MSLGPGSTIGPFKIQSLLGAGGMGEVFRARDTRLNRDVAIKVLPSDFASDPDRLHRFESEAKTLAALNHPNILTIHDTGLRDGTPFLVSELLEGGTLREELSTGPLPLRKALDCSLQIAQGLAAAHARGIIHRDLKPENIFITKDGRVKILDFGLAKLTSHPHSKFRNAHGSDSPTLLASTTPGVILGTPAYMSPEQVRGEPADHRSDIFSFGCVLHEMLAGSSAFRRDTPVASMNAILSEDPPPAGPNVPPSLARIALRCLEKLPERRFQTAADLAFALEGLTSGFAPALAAANSPAISRPAFLPWAVAALAILLATAAVLFRSRPIAARAPAPGPLRQFEITLPLPEKKYADPGITGLAISPDGRKLTYVNADGLWLRALDKLDPPMLLASGTISAPFWSPDSSEIGWFDKDSLRRVSAEGGRPVTICAVEITSQNSGEGAAWLQGGELIFTTGAAGLYQVSAAGGEPTTVLSPAEGELDFHSPVPWPDGKHVLFAVHKTSGPVDTIAVWNVKEPGRDKRVFFRKPNLNILHTAVAGSGHLVLSGFDTLWSLPISVAAVQPSGELLRLEHQGAIPAVSSDGTLVVIPLRKRNSASHHLVWVDRSGKISAPLPSAQGDIRTARLSPDERQIAFASYAPNGESWLWLLDLSSSAALPLRPEEAGAEFIPFWFPDGRKIAFTAWHETELHTFARPIEGGVRQRIAPGFLQHLSADGSYAFLRRGRPLAGTNYFVQLGASAPAALPDSLRKFESLQPRLSPSSSVLAYQSDETGQNEIWTLAFPGFTNRVLVSRGRGGASPLWSRDGRELFYLARDWTALMVAPFLTNSSPHFGEPSKLFDLPHGISSPAAAFARAGTALFDISRDGQRFLMLHETIATNSAAPAEPPKILLIQNWLEEARKTK